MRSISGTIGVAACDSSALVRCFTDADPSSVVAWANAFGVTRVEAVDAIENFRASKLRLRMQCAHEGHQPRWCWGVGLRKALREVCVRCGEDLPLR